MKILMVLASIAPNAERTDGNVSPTLMARAGTGGGQLPILILETHEYDGDLHRSTGRQKVDDGDRNRHIQPDNNWRYRRYCDGYIMQ